VVRVGLFFDGDHVAGALVLAQTKAESITLVIRDRFEAAVAEAAASLPRGVAELVFWAIVVCLRSQKYEGGKSILRCAPKSVRRWCRVESQNQL
jgi:hypothetical protein